ncbi:MAG: NUDIX domain-containing protein [Propionibacteriaceae bacterium]|nr:NUDIX domain-containing protein [Propionibacteriaceae bacterium]
MHGDIVLAASAVIIDGEGRVLLVKRGKEPQKGRWSVPGGSVEAGETLEEAAAREAREETGLEVTVGRELWSLSTPTGDGRMYEIHDFEAAVIGGDLAAGDDADDVRWVAPAEFKDMLLTVGLVDYLRRAGIAADDI